MKKTFLKSVVATAVVTAAVALSSVVAFAYTLPMDTAANATVGDASQGVSITPNIAPEGRVRSYTVTRADGTTLEGNNDCYKFGSNTDAISITVEKASKITTVASGGGSGTRELYLLDSTGAQVATLATTTDTSTYAIYEGDIAPGTYTIQRQSGKTMRLYYLDVTPSDATLYGELNDATEGNTVTIPSDTVKGSMTVEEWCAAAGVDTTATNPVVSTEATVGIFRVVAASNRTMTYNTDANKISFGGGTNSSGRYVEFAAEAGDVLKINGLISGSSTDANRYLYLSTSVAGAAIDSVYAPVGEAMEGTITIPAAGTYYLCSSGNVMISGLELVAGTEVAAPYVTLSEADTTNYAGKVAYMATIAGNADERVVVNAINFLTAKGSKESTLDVVSNPITNVYDNGTDYVFVVTIDADSVNALPGLRAQVALDTEGGMLYSNVVEYVPETTA